MRVGKQEKDEADESVMAMAMFVKTAEYHHQEEPERIASANEAVFEKGIVPEGEEELLNHGKWSKEAE